MVRHSVIKHTREVNRSIVTAPPSLTGGGIELIIPALFHQQIVDQVVRRVDRAIMENILAEKDHNFGWTSIKTTLVGWNAGDYPGRNRDLGGCG